MIFRPYLLEVALGQVVDLTVTSVVGLCIDGAAASGEKGCHVERG